MRVIKLFEMKKVAGGLILFETNLRNQSVSPREADPPLGRRRRNVSATADTAGGYVNQTILEAV